MTTSSQNRASQDSKFIFKVDRFKTEKEQNA